MKKRPRPPDLLSANSLFTTISSRFVMKNQIKIFQTLQVQIFKKTRHQTAMNELVNSGKKVSLCLFLYVADKFADSAFSRHLFHNRCIKAHGPNPKWRSKLDKYEQNTPVSISSAK